MANVLGTLFQDIANAIRSKTGGADTMKPAEFPAEISSIVVGEDNGVRVRIRSGTFGTLENEGGNGRRNIVHGESRMPDLIYCYCRNNTQTLVLGSEGWLEFAVKQAPIVSALGMKAKFITMDVDGYANDYTPTISSLYSPYEGAINGRSTMVGINVGSSSAIDRVSSYDPCSSTGDIWCPDEYSFNVGAAASNEDNKLIPDASYTWLAIWLSEGSSGSSADICYVTFIGADGTELYKKAVAVGDDCIDVYAKGLISKPTKASTVAQTFTYSGWSLTDGGAASSNALKTVTEDRTVYAAFTASARKYAARFYDDSGALMQESQVAYGTQATPPDTLRDGYLFVSWTPSDLTIYEDTDFVGAWEVDQGWLIVKEFPTTAATTPYGNFVYSLDGTRLYTAYSVTSDSRGKVCMFDTTTQPYTLLKSVEVYGMTPVPDCKMAISPDGNWLAVTRYRYGDRSGYYYNSCLEVFSISGNTLTKASVVYSTKLTYQVTGIGVVFSLDSKYLYLLDSGTSVTRFTVGTTSSVWPHTRFTLKAESNSYLSNARDMVISPDGTKMIVVASGNISLKGILVFDLENAWENVTSTYLNRAYVWTDCALSPDGKYLACTRGSELNGKTMEVFDITTTPYTSVIDANVGFVKSGVSFSPDGKLLAFALDTSPYLRVLDVDTWTEKNAPMVLPDGTSYNCTFNNDGTRLILAHENAPYVKLYEVKQ